MQELQFVEFYAGVGNVWRSVAEAGYPAARADYAYYQPDDPYWKQNCMDILTSAGFGIFGWFLLIC